MASAASSHPRRPSLPRGVSTASALNPAGVRTRPVIPGCSSGYVELVDAPRGPLDAFERRREHLPELALRRKVAAAQRQNLERAVRMIASAQRIWRCWRALRVRRVNACRPEHFTCKDGSPADYGTITFEKHGVREPAPYIRISDTTDLDKVVGLMADVWGVRRARVVISLTGGAQELNLKPHVHEAINRGLVRAAQQSSAWVVTGGTDSGVMKLMGEAVRDHQADVPCVGVCTWGAVHGREQLASNRGEERFYRKLQRSDATGASLEPNHSHFILIDTGKEGSSAWGGEIRARMHLEQLYCERFNNLPMVLVVIGGGAGTLTTIKEAARSHVPVVLIPDSGGAPATVAHYMRTRELVTDPLGERGIKPPRDPAAGMAAWRESTLKTVAEIVEADASARVLTSFSTRVSALNADLDLVLLQAMLFDTEGNLRTREAHESRKMLQLAIEWGRREIAQKWMEKSGTLIAAVASPQKPAGMPLRRRRWLTVDPRTASVIVEEALRDALLLALRVRKADIVDLLLQQDVKADDLAVLELWKALVPHLRSFALPLEQLHRCLQKWDTLVIGSSVKQIAEAWDASSPDSAASLLEDGSGLGGTSNWLSAIAARIAGRRWQRRASDSKSSRDLLALQLAGSGRSAPPLLRAAASARTERRGFAHGFFWRAWAPAGRRRSLSLQQQAASSDSDSDGGEGASDAGGDGLRAGGAAGSDAQAQLRAKHHAYAHVLYRRHIIPFLASTFKMRELADEWAVSPHSGRGGSSFSHRGKRAGAEAGTQPWRVSDLLYWALLNPLVDDELVHTLWRHTDEPIRMALTASHIASRLGSLARFSTRRHEKAALLYESWATGVLSCCTNEVEARWLLQRQFDNWPAGRTGGSLMTLAIRRTRKSFIAHQHSQSLLDAWWMGDLVERWQGTWEGAVWPGSARLGAARGGKPGGTDDRMRGATCLEEHSSTWYNILLHALTGARFGIVQMEPTHAAKYHYYRAVLAVRAAQRSDNGESASSEPLVSIFAPEVWREIRPPRVGWRSQAADFFSAPKTKFVLRTSCYVAFLWCYGAVIMNDDGSPAFSPLEVGFFLWALTHGLDELHQFFKNRARDDAHFDDQGWNVLDAVMFWVLFPLIVTLRVLARAVCCAHPVGSLPELGSEDKAPCYCQLKVNSRLILAVNAVLCFIRFLANYRVHKRLGVLIHVIRTMFKDIQIFIYILAIVLAGFAFCFGGIAPPRHLKFRADGASPFMLPAWNLFDLTDIDAVTNPELSSMPALGMATLALYLFVSQILLVNLLIAMMNTSYVEANKKSEEEWAASRASSVQELLTLLPVPPPFSLPYLLYYFGVELGAACGYLSPRRTADAHCKAHEAVRTLDRRAVRSAERKFLHEYLDTEAAREAGSTEQRIGKLLSEVDRLASLVEAASSERAEASAALDRIEERVDMLAGVKSAPADVPVSGSVSIQRSRAKSVVFEPMPAVSRLESPTRSSWRGDGALAADKLSASKSTDGESSLKLALAAGAKDSPHGWADGTRTSAQSFASTNSLQEPLQSQPSPTVKTGAAGHGELPSTLTPTSAAKSSGALQPTNAPRKPSVGGDAYSVGAGNGSNRAGVSPTPSGSRLRHSSPTRQRVSHRAAPREPGNGGLPGALARPRLGQATSSDND